MFVVTTIRVYYVLILYSIVSGKSLTSLMFICTFLRTHRVTVLHARTFYPRANTPSRISSLRSTVGHFVKLKRGEGVEPK